MVLPNRKFRPPNEIIKDNTANFWTTREEKLGAERVTTVAYMMNRTEPFLEPGIPPYQLWYSKKTGIGNLKVFTSECYVDVS